MPADPPCVLVVDDDPGIRTILQAVLEDAGYTVETASDGVEALERIAARRPALVLLDLQLPLLTGQEVLAELRRLAVPVPVVFLSAGMRAEHEATRHGADAALAKPFDLDALLAVVERFCG